MKIIYPLFILLITVVATSGQEKFDKEKSEIINVLLSQQESWNNGNLEEYMSGYWNSDSLRFIGSKGITYGWDTTLKNYKKGYPDKKTMGILKFDIISVEPLSKKKAMLIGKWALTRESGNVSGHYILIWQKFTEGWKIIVDHTS